MTTYAIWYVVIAVATAILFGTISGKSSTKVRCGNAVFAVLWPVTILIVAMVLLIYFFSIAVAVGEWARGK